MLEISRTPWRNYLYLTPAFFLLPFSKYKGLECKKTFWKAFKTEALWFITVRALKQPFNTKLYWQEQFHEAMLLIWLKDFYNLWNEQDWQIKSSVRHYFHSVPHFLAILSSLIVPICTAWAFYQDWAVVIQPEKNQALPRLKNQRSL